MANTIVAAGDYPRKHNNRENKVIETARADLKNANVAADAAIAVTKLGSMADAKILVGDGSATNEVAVSGDITIDSAGVTTIGADKVDVNMLDQGQIKIDFTKQAYIPSVHITTDDVSNFATCAGESFETININTQTIGPLQVLTGVDISCDQTENDGLEFGNGDGVVRVPNCAKTVGTDNFYFRAKVDIANVSGTDDLCIGLRKAQDYAPALNTYTDFYGAGFNAQAATQAIKLRSQLNGAATTNTDTTQTLDDAEYLDVKIWQGDEARLLSSIELMAELKSTINTHFADATEHTARVQAALAAAAPTTTATLIVAITEAMASYVIHDADANLAADWVYHIADGDDDSLASEVAPTTLAECVTRINDLRTKVDLHVADGTSHTDGDSGLNTAGIPQAANVHCLLGVNAALAVPTVAVAYDFDSTDVIVPCIYFLQAGTAQAGIFNVLNWEIVDVATV